MYESDISIHSYLYGLQGLSLLLQSFSYAMRSFDKTRLRFLIVLVFFFVLNTIWIIPENSWINYLGSKTIWLLVIGFSLVGYVYHYFSVEFGLSKHKYFSSLSLCVVLMLVETIRSFSTTDYPNLHLIFFAIYESIALLFVGHLIVRIFRRKHETNPIFFAAISSLTLFLVIPLAFFFMKASAIMNLMINVVFMAISIAYLRHHITQTSKENKTLKNFTTQLNLNLNDRYKTELDLFHNANPKITSRERATLILLLKGFSYEEIAEQNNITADTARKHASNAFAKLEKGMKLHDFLEKYPRIPRNKE